MVLDPQSHDLLPCGPGILEGLDSRFKPELPASHVEIATNPHRRIDLLAAELLECRSALSAHVSGRALLAAAGVHPFTARTGELNSTERYARMLAEYGDVMRQQLICGLHVHVRLGGADRVLAVYNAMRSYLPELAALAANAPVHCERDTTLASVRPLICGLMPRQGVPPPIGSWEEYAARLNWGVGSKRLGQPREWWWELRPHGGVGTLEIRVPDAQTTVGEAMAVVAVAAGVAVWLAERHDAGELEFPAETWRINENRWTALRNGMDGYLVDVQTGVRRPARERLGWLIDQVEPVLHRLGGASQLDAARAMLGRNGASRQRELFRAGGAVELTGWLAERFLLDEAPGRPDGRSRPC